MKIAECKQYKILPTAGTRVATQLLDVPLPNIKTINLYRENRIATNNGIFIGIVDGSTGEYWWVLNELNSTTGIYHYTEVSDPHINIVEDS